METVSPLSLEEICLSYIGKNIEYLCHEDGDQGLAKELGSSCPKVAFNSPIFLHEQLAEGIMKSLSCNGNLNTRTAWLFSNLNTCRIRKLDLCKSEISHEVIKHLLMQHKVLKLDLQGTNLPVWVLDEVLELTSMTLQELNVSHTDCVLDFAMASKLSHLTHLDIRNTIINDDNLLSASQYLNCLEFINISQTAICETISFGTLRSQLKTLLAFDAPVAWNNPVEFRAFTSMRVLDISRNMNSAFGYVKKLEEMFLHKDLMPELAYLDVSGTSRISDHALQTFLFSHTNLQFLGLFDGGSGSASLANWLPTNIEITGVANQQQIHSTLKAYPDRPRYITEALRGLFQLFKNGTGVNTNSDILQLVLTPMEKHAKDFGVQLAGTACIFSIIRGRGAEQVVHPVYLSKIASLVLSAMRSFVHYRNDLTRNCLLILETRQLLKKATFSYFEAFSCAMDALYNFSSLTGPNVDQTTIRLAIKLCAILSCRISTSETLALGSERNILMLLNIAREKIASNESDYILSLTLSVLWNLTDETPKTCHLFVEKGGLELATQALNVFREGVQDQHIIVKKKILGTLNNIAEVPELRKHLITKEFMTLLGCLLEGGFIQLAYFCGGILSNVMLNWSNNDLLPLNIKEVMLLKLDNAVTSWDLPPDELVAYRSFNPFVQLLECPMPAVQMWAMWGILHVCTRDVKRYFSLLAEGRIMETVQKVITSSNERVAELGNRVIDAVKDLDKSRSQQIL